MKKTFSYWPLDFEPEDQIYENPSWDLPGLRRKLSDVRKKKSSLSQVPQRNCK